MGKKGRNTEKKKAAKTAEKNISHKLDDLLLKAQQDLQDVTVFTQPPPRMNCPICCCALPADAAEYAYKSCCGNVICGGCILASNVATLEINEDKKNKGLPQLPFVCAFCREPDVLTNEEAVERIRQRMVLNDPEAYRNMATFYRDGCNGCPKDGLRALENFHKAAELGLSTAYNDLAWFYDKGIAVDESEDKVHDWLTIAAKMGNEYAHDNLGEYYEKKGDIDLAAKHWFIAAKCGDQDSMNKLRDYFSKEGTNIDRDELTKTLRLCFNAQAEVKTEERDRYKKFVETGKLPEQPRKPAPTKKKPTPICPDVSKGGGGGKPL